jgi:hypothetical protein
MFCTMLLHMLLQSAVRSRLRRPRVWVSDSSCPWVNHRPTWAFRLSRKAAKATSERTSSSAPGLCFIPGKHRSVLQTVTSAWRHSRAITDCALELPGPLLQGSPERRRLQRVRLACRGCRCCSPIPCRPNAPPCLSTALWSFAPALSTASPRPFHRDDRLAHGGASTVPSMLTGFGCGSLLRSSAWSDGAEAVGRRLSCTARCEGASRAARTMGLDEGPAPLPRGKSTGRWTRPFQCARSGGRNV